MRGEGISGVSAKKKPGAGPGFRISLAGISGCLVDHVAGAGGGRRLGLRLHGAAGMVAVAVRAGPFCPLG